MSQVISVKAEGNAKMEEVDLDTTEVAEMEPGLPWEQCMLGCEATPDSQLILLPCLHAFCSATCANQWITLLASENASCPPYCNICHVSFTSDDLKRSIIPSKKFKRKLTIEDVENKIECGYCIHNRVPITYCPECPGYLCEECTKLHKVIKKTFEHKPESSLLEQRRTVELELIRANQRHCKLHKKDCTHFCLKCQLKLCAQCVDKHNKNHEIVGISEERDKMDTKIAMASELKKRVSEAILALEEKRNTLAAEEVSLGQKIDAEIERVISEVKLRGDYLKKEVKKMFIEKSECLQKKLQVFDQVKHSATHFNDTWNKVLDNFDEDSIINFSSLSAFLVEFLSVKHDKLVAVYDNLIEKDCHFMFKNTNLSQLYRSIGGFGSITYGPDELDDEIIIIHEEFVKPHTVCVPKKKAGENSMKMTLSLRNALSKSGGKVNGLRKEKEKEIISVRPSSLKEASTQTEVEEIAGDSERREIVTIISEDSSSSSSEGFGSDPDIEESIPAVINVGPSSLRSSRRDVVTEGDLKKVNGIRKNLSPIRNVELEEEKDKDARDESNGIFTRCKRTRHKSGNSTLKDSSPDRLSLGEVQTTQLDNHSQKQKIASNEDAPSASSSLIDPVPHSSKSIPSPVVGILRKTTSSPYINNLTSSGRKHKMDHNNSDGSSSPQPRFKIVRFSLPEDEEGKDSTDKIQSSLINENDTDRNENGDENVDGDKSNTDDNTSCIMTRRKQAIISKQQEMTSPSQISPVPFAKSKGKVNRVAVFDPNIYPEAPIDTIEALPENFDYPVHLTPASEDSLCFICLDSGDKLLVCCDSCPKAFHALCHIPPVTEGNGNDGWHCNHHKSKEEFYTEVYEKPDTPGSENQPLTSANQRCFMVACKFLMEIYKIPEIPTLKWKFTEAYFAKYGKVPYHLKFLKEKLCHHVEKDLQPFSNVEEYMLAFKQMFSQAILIHSGQERRCALECYRQFRELISSYYPEFEEVFDDLRF